MPRATKQTWLDEALQILSEQGASELTIERLTQRLKLTKGSFYHHFKSYDGFKHNLLDHYEDISTLHIIRLTDEEAMPQRKIVRLLKIATEYPPGTEVGFRNWALQDPDVRICQERIDAQRQTYVCDLFLAMGYSLANAQLMARIFYAILIGGEHMLPTLTLPDFMAMFHEFLRLYDIPFDE